MGARLTFGTAGATGGGFSAMPGALQPAYEEPHHHPRWSMQQRSPRTLRDRHAFFSRWSFGCRVGYGDVSGANGTAPVGRTITEKDTFEPYSIDLVGTQSTKFIRGVCVDSTGAVAASATLYAYRSSDSAYAGTAVANQNDGTFSVPTPFSGVNHFVVAYKAGSPDIAGTTVNTLVPANLDGS
ncbi:MAG: hypothetical protein FJ027_19270 [Candidatus Rokubacteria bacterium]|nr:hypothetical protein [Candidatus Rokubacteria bacterium]